MTQVLEHLLPDTDINLQTLRAYLQTLERDDVPNSVTPSASDGTFSSYALTGSHAASADQGHDDVSITDEMNELYSELGKMRLDPRGVPSKLTKGDPDPSALSRFQKRVLTNHVRIRCSWLCLPLSFNSSVYERASIKQPRQK